MRLRQLWRPLAALLSFSYSLLGPAQGPKPRLATPISGGARVTLPGTRPAFADGGRDEGALPASSPLRGMTLVFNLSPAQKVELDTLLAAQADPHSPLFHHWLTPDQFAAHFGVADADLARVQTWLQGQGFQVSGVSRSRNRITFDGTAGQVANAFGTELHRYTSGSRSHFAPATDVSVPASLAPMVTTVLHLSDLRAHAYTRVMPQPAYTSSQSGNNFLTPADVATMYDVNSVYKMGYNGTGQAIAVLGQSYVDLSAVAAFQSGAGLTPNTPTLVLVPQTGVPGINAFGDGDEEESQLDLEYAAGMAPGANVLLVYTGDSENSAGIFDSLAYTVDQNLAPVITGSYGLCEGDLGTPTQAAQVAAVYSQIVQQANAQGQTIFFSSGDTGSEGCYNSTAKSPEEQLAVSFPASIPGITAVGGLQMQAGTFFRTGNVAGSGSQYWQTSTGSDLISSLRSYAPETVWNENTLAAASNALSAGGGGTSTLYPRPTWQAGVPGISAGTNRLLPDVSLQASTSSPGFLFCTSDEAGLAGAGVTSSCSNGLRGSSGLFTVAGGTSFAAPIMAGLTAVLNQAKGAAGQGNVNPVLYALASDSARYSTVFHDITTGTNACVSGTSFCSAAGAASYSATPGYDEASGLGSFDFANLVAAWPATTGASATAAASVTTVIADSLAPGSGSTDEITVTVAGAVGGGPAATGTVSLTVDGSGLPVLLTLNNGQATYTYPGTAELGSHALVASYSGDANYLPSRGTVVLTLAGSTTPTGSFTLTAENISVATNGQASGTITIVPGAGYSGTIAFSLSYTTSGPTLCFYTTSADFGRASNVTTDLAHTGSATAKLTILQGTACGGSASAAALPLRPGSHRTPGSHPWAPGGGWPEGAVFAGLMVVGLSSRRTRRVPTLLSVAALAAVGLGVSGCGGGSGSNLDPVKETQPQTVTMLLTGTDTVNGSITASTTLQVTVRP